MFAELSRCHRLDFCIIRKVGSTKAAHHDLWNHSRRRFSSEVSAEQRQELWELWELWEAKRERGNMQMEQEGHESGGKRNKAGANGTALTRWRTSKAVSTSGLYYCVDEEVQ